MAQITVEVSDKALEILQRTAEIRHISLDEMAKSLFGYYEQLATGAQDLTYHYESETKKQLRLEAQAYYKKHTYHNYYVHRKGKHFVEVMWWDCPMIDPHNGYSDKQEAEHYGQFQLKICYGETLTTTGFGVNFITKTDYEFYPTLKRLKKAVNRWFKKYGHAPYYKT